MTNSPKNLNLPASVRSRLPEIAVSPQPKSFRFEVENVTKPVFEFAAQDDAAVITIFAEIGGAAGVTAAKVESELRRIGNKPVLLKINSPGGNYFDGIAIYNLLRAHPGRVTAHVLGQAASAASIIAIAADRTAIARNAEIMIHRVWVAAMGNRDTMIEAATILDRTDTALAATYAARTGLPRSRIIEMMAAETHMVGATAVELGFADEILDTEAAPKLRTAAAPQSKRALEAHLRSVGFAKAAAEKIVAGGWPALGGSPAAVETRSAIDRITSLTQGWSN